MHITERPDVASALLAQARSHKGYRDPSWHQSDHNRCLIKSVVGRFIQDKFNVDNGDEGEWLIDERTALMFLRGAGIGAFLAEHTPEEVFFAPGVGWCSIDRPWTDDDGRTVPMEIKTTRFSSAYPITEHENYISQLATYVAKREAHHNRAINPAGTYAGYIYALYEQGDYVERKPEHRAFQFKFTGQELLDWEGELRRRHYYLEDSLTTLNRRWETDPQFQLEMEKLRDQIPVDLDLASSLPPITEHYQFECDKYSECPMKELIHCKGTGPDGTWGLPFQIDSEFYVREHRERGRKAPKKEKKV